MTVYYIDATQGSDNNTGLSANTAFRTLEKVEGLLKAGDTICLERGSVWYEDLSFKASNVTVQAYGTGANPLINGGGTRSGIVAQGENASIQNIDVTNAINGVYVTGANASATIIGGNYTANGTGIVAGGGGRLILVDGAVTTGNTTRLGAGDGIQISADASTGVHTIVNVTANNNAISGINAKAGTVTVSDSTLSFNGQPGWIAQNNIDVFNISGSRIEGNNQSDVGVGQASIEDRAIVNSTNNLYLNPHNGQWATVQINIVEGAGWQPASLPNRPITLNSSGDTFVNTSGQTNTVGSIRVNTNGTAAVVTVEDATFNHAAGSGIAIDAYGATNLDLRLSDNIFNMVNTRAVRVHGSADFGVDLASNTFIRTDGGMVFEIQDAESYTMATLQSLLGKYAVPGASEPAPRPTDAAPQPSPEPSTPPQTDSGQQPSSGPSATPTDPTNHAPTAITLSASTVAENKAGAVIGAITVTDPGEKWGFVFTVSDDRFEVVGAPGAYRLKLVDSASLDYEREASVKVTVTARDPGGLSKDQDFNIAVTDVAGVTINGSQWVDVINGGSTVLGNAFATQENDKIRGNGGADTINGLAGHDVINGGEGNDVLYGDAGDDWLFGGPGLNKLWGGDGNDEFEMTGSNGIFDWIVGGNGTDTIVVTGSGPVTKEVFVATESSIEAWRGNGQAVLGTAGADRFDFSGLSSLSGVSRIAGLDGNDSLVGSRFADTLDGGLGSDRIQGGAGNDVLTGGPGHDVFVLRAGFGRDLITDFQPTGTSAEIVEVSKDLFSSYKGVIGASKQIGSDVVITTASGDTLTLSNVSLSSLSIDDFRFV